MSLRRQIIWCGSAALALVLLLVLTLVWLAGEKAVERVHRTTTDDVTKTVTQLRFLMVETILFHEERSISQWQAKNMVLQKLLQTSLRTNPEWRSQLQNLGDDSAALDTLYQRMVGVLREPKDTADESKTELVNRTMGALMVTSQQMLGNANDLIRAGRGEADRRDEQVTTLIVLIVTALASVIGILLTILRQRVLQPVSVLQEGLVKIAGGDLSLRLDIRDSSEIGALSKTYNSMADELEASYGRLRLEVTEREAAQAKLEQSNTDLIREAHRAEVANSAKGQFLANMSHEIRTPLNAVMGLLQLLARTAMDARQQKYVVDIRKAAHTLLDILNDILDFSKAEAGRMVLDAHRFRLDELLQDIGVILSANVGSKDVEILFDIDPGVPRWLVGDALRLKQVMINLAGNAIKFTERGEVALELRLENATPDQLELSFTIRDTGIGIAAEQLEKIFEGFMQAEASTARRFGGTGLGLAISDRLVRLMGGTLKVSSELGQGSSFKFNAKFGLSEASDHSALPYDGLHGLRTLVIEDNRHVQEVLQRMAQSFGWATDLATNGDEGIARIRQRLDTAQSYQLILIDWSMPGLDSWEICRSIRQLRGAIRPVVVLMTTNLGREEISQRLLLEPDVIDGFLMKPATASGVFDTVSDLMDRRGQSRQSAVCQNGTQKRLSGLRLLLVEDNPTNQRVAQELLEQEGATVVVAASGQAGLKVLSTLDADAPPFDAVLMDIQMPGLDGYATARYIRGELAMPDLPIIAITANAMVGDQKASLDAGMNAHVAKPFYIEDLASVLLRLCKPRIAAASSSTDAIWHGNPHLHDLLASLESLLLRKNPRSLDVFGLLQREAAAAGDSTSLAALEGVLSSGDYPAAVIEAQQLQARLLE